MRLVRELNQLRRGYGVSFNKAYDHLAAQAREERGDDAVPQRSRSHAYRLLKRERNGHPLHRGNATKGNRTERYREEVFDVIVDMANKHFLETDSVWRIGAFTEAVNMCLHDAGHIPPDKNVSKKFVLRVILTRVHVDPEHCRMQPKDAIGAKAVARKKICVAYPFERVEQDALHLPFAVTTRYGVSRTVYVVHAIDCATSMVLGWCLVIGAASVSSTLKCVETILFPKKPRLKQLEVNFDLDIYGTPSHLVLDNGPENRGERVQGLTKISIDPDNLKANHPHHKPFIERLNRSLKEYLESLPGCTRKDGKDGKRDPVALGDSLMDVEELERWIVRFYFEHWARRQLKRLTHDVFTERTSLGKTPLTRFRTLTVDRGYPIPLPPSVDAWRSVAYEQLLKPLSRKSGISYKTYQYRGDRLSYLIDRLGEYEVRVLVDPDDFRVVYVVDRDERTLIPLVNTCIDDTVPAYSFKQAEEILKAQPQEGVDATVAALRRDLLRRSLGMDKPDSKGSKTGTTGKPKPTKHEVSRETARRARDDDAVRRGVASPLPATSHVVGNPLITAPTDNWENGPAVKMIDRHTGESRS
jgi:putative transposase